MWNEFWPSLWKCLLDYGEDNRKYKINFVFFSFECKGLIVTVLVTKLDLLFFNIGDVFTFNLRRDDRWLKIYYNNFKSSKFKV